MTLADVRIGGSRIVLAPHNCFACGSLNTHGIQLELHAGDGRCWTELELDRRFEGWEGIAHGGIVSTILDEVMAWALVDNDSWGVTARMSVEFKRPVPIGRPIRAEGRVVEVRRRIVRRRGRRSSTPPTATVLATAEGTFVAAPDAQKQALKERYGFRLEPELTATPDAVDRRPGSDHVTHDRGSRPMTAATAAAPASVATARARAFVAARKADGDGPRTRGGRARPRPGRARRHPQRRAARPRGPRVPRGHAAWSRRASVPSSASASRCSARSAAASGPRSAA